MGNQLELYEENTYGYSYLAMKERNHGCDCDSFCKRYDEIDFLTQFGNRPKGGPCRSKARLTPLALWLFPFLHPYEQAHGFRIEKAPNTFVLRALLSAVWTGLEPATPCVTGRYSNQLNYQTNDFVRHLTNSDNSQIQILLQLLLKSVLVY